MKNKKLLLFISFVIFSYVVKAQSDIMYFMNETPQSSFINPAFGSKLGSTYISLPALSGLNFNFNTSGYCYHDLINQHPIYKDSLQIDLNGFYNKLKSSLDINILGDISLFGLGITFGKTHLSLDLKFGFSSRIELDKSIFGFILDGFGNEDKGLVLDAPLLNIQTYISPSVSLAREFGDKLKIGTRVGMLFGIMDITSKETIIAVTENNGTLAVETNFDVLTANIFGRFRSNSLFNDTTNSTEFNMANMNDILSTAFNNKGFVIDVGGAYKITDNMEVSLGVSDFGFIKWTTNTTAIRSKHPNNRVEFDGIRSSLDSLSSQVEEYLEHIGDTLLYITDMKADSIAPYTSMLPTKLYAGLTWKFFGASYLHALYKGVIGNGYFDNYFSIFYGLHWGAIALSFGNTFSTHVAFNPSFSVSLTGIGFNIYAGGSFSFTKSGFNVADMSAANIFAGVNLLIGRKPYWKSSVIPL
ncbi:MAG: DUF5723 family protein [Bacteroidales bacterium]|jgi:hypothetical protein|nr:DUF5723 family protein [Bacteroidales bacterium]